MAGRLKCRESNNEFVNLPGEIKGADKRSRASGVLRPLEEEEALNVKTLEEPEVPPKP